MPSCDKCSWRIYTIRKLSNWDKNPPWWTVITLFSPLFAHFRLCYKSDRESIDVLLYTSRVKNEGLVSNIRGCAVLFCGAFQMYFIFKIEEVLKLQPATLSPFDHWSCRIHICDLKGLTLFRWEHKLTETCNFLKFILRYNAS